jgi:hypothetical protein
MYAPIYTSLIKEAKMYFKVSNFPDQLHGLLFRDCIYLIFVTFSVYALPEEGRVGPENLKL